MNRSTFYQELEKTKWGQEYLELIHSKKNYESGTILETHHIYPKSFEEGNIQEDNLVQLSCKDHVLAHYYLALAIPCRETLWAFKFMVTTRSGEKVSLEEAGRLREEAAKIFREEYLPRWVNPDTVKKGRQTRKERYGSEYGTLLNPENQKKARQRSLEVRRLKYGSAAAHMHTDEARAKQGDTIAKKYGGDRAGQLHTEAARKKLENTIKSRYGGDVMGMCHTEEAAVKRTQTFERMKIIVRSKAFLDWYIPLKENYSRKNSAVRDYLKTFNLKLEDFNYSNNGE